jgi:hypothetical protein
MRTERLLVVAALACAAGPARADDAPGRWTVQLDAEASVIGESYGPRAELLWRVGGAYAVSHVRIAAGYLVGPELSLAPISLGYRAVFRGARRIQPWVGAGWENHHFVLDATPDVHRWLVLYVEGGCGVEVRPRLTLGVATSLDLALLRDIGPGLQLRAYAAWRF